MILVTWLRRGPFAVAFLIALPVRVTSLSVSHKTTAQRGVSKLLPEEEKESYDIWSTVLRIKEPRVAAWTIVQQTRGFELCLKPAQGRRTKRGSFLNINSNCPYTRWSRLNRGQEVPLSEHLPLFPPLVLIAHGPALPSVSGAVIAARATSCSTKAICGSSMDTGAATVVVGQREESP